ncbi:MAG TPA: c-type cytochrome [Gaiellales bacterium]|jgi:cytochrome c551/c552|nr:c-type cytochrome [Gaiellales bacterium]
MIKVLVAALVGTIIGIVVMVAVIAIAGTDTSGASSVGLGALPNSTFTPSGSTGGGTAPPPASGGSSGPSSSGGGGNAANGKVLFTSKTCAGCHSVVAGTASPFPSAPNLAELNASGVLTTAKILNQIQNAAPPMPAGLASGQDAADLAAYILTLK